ncbi:DUF4129 domain-containing protein [Tahibacter amnicola]|uniref:DUF4129 domain-containing protein n=1 Tax=Tahibacter amnicola TaxID=2976241 RepID=A0ABY6BET7_9GAMM|nr:DUF4129 domain-containing protein [Tahibacter amnicola]UXI68032.1 DUF4129 domain-containing protein [Tahibacter amnicola]
MQLEELTIAVRRRAPWEAADLGIALVRHHARAIWVSWIIATLPVALAFMAVGALLDQMWIASVLLWWFKPAFDRVPLFVLSRAVFGETPSLRQTLESARRWGWSGIWPWLLWRRLNPARALLLGVDLLEGLTGARRSQRVRLLAKGSGTPASMLTIVGIHLDTMLSFSIIVSVLIFVPTEFLSDSAQAMWRTLTEEPPLWAQMLLYLAGWIGMSIVEPFYVGAGFGLYLNRRTELEAWDVELVFRRLAARLQPAAAVVLALATVLFVAPTVRAEAVATAPVDSACEQCEHTEPDETDAADAAPDQDGDRERSGRLEEMLGLDDLHAKTNTAPLETVFGSGYQADSTSFQDNVAKAYTDPDLNPKATITTWQRRNPLESSSSSSRTNMGWARHLGQFFGVLAEAALWALVAFGVYLLVRYRDVWLSWLPGGPVRRAPDTVDVHELTVPERLPDDIPAAIRALIAAGQHRAALALLYRASVERLAVALGAPLPPGATESECVRRARNLGEDPYAALFIRIVRLWQAAAYASRLPTSAELEALLREWSAPPRSAAP